MVEVKKVIKKEKEVAIVKNTATFLEKIAEMRNISPENAWYRVCQDGGGGSFKSMVSVMDQQIDPTKEDKGELLSGVNRLLALAVAPGVPERHFNLGQIMNHLSFHLVPQLKVVMDLCLLNSMLGISSHGGKYSCAFCEGASVLTSGNLRTFGHLQQKYEEYQAAPANPAKMKDFANVIKSCLSIAYSKTLVVEKHPLPELHLNMGVVHHLLKLCSSVDCG